ncbi:hypothetical protein BH09BAC6_BH09BAC6_10400 [soil metagenome]|jgi:hypothetical protein
MKNILILIFLIFNSGRALAQTHLATHGHDKVNIAGTYSLTLVDNILADGSRVHLYGLKPNGLLMIDTNGYYILQIVGNNRLKFAAGDKSKGTEKENKAAIEGSNSHFGTYTINTDTNTITFFIAYASFPNWEGTQQKRSFSFDGHTLKYTVPSPTTGGSASGEVEWKKLN